MLVKVLISVSLIAMNFTICNFEQLEEEWTNNGKIMWEVEGSLDSKGRIKNKDGLPSKLKTGSIVYFYVNKIPSSSGTEKSRILLRGEVIDEPHVVQYKDVYWRSEKTDMIIGFSIGNLTTLQKEQLDDDKYLSLVDLKEKDRNFIYPQGRRWPNQDDGNLSTEIIDILENSFKKVGNKNDFRSLICHFNQECFFCGKIGVKNDHKTFKRRNGTDYFEYHHFIQQHKGEGTEELKEIINAPENLICLCSNCHNKIHYGQVDEVNHMLDLLWKDAGIQVMLNRFNFSNLAVLKGNEPLDWIKSTYIANYVFERKENDIIKGC